MMDGAASGGHGIVQTRFVPHGTRYATEDRLPHARTHVLKLILNARKPYRLLSR